MWDADGFQDRASRPSFRSSLRCTFRSNLVSHLRRHHFRGAHEFLLEGRPCSWRIADLWAPRWTERENVGRKLSPEMTCCRQASVDLGLSPGRPAPAGIEGRLQHLSGLSAKAPCRANPPLCQAGVRKQCFVGNQPSVNRRRSRVREEGSRTEMLRKSVLTFPPSTMLL